VGRVHLVGEAPAGLSGKRRRGLRDLAIAVALGALVWIGDAATGGRIAGAVNAFASRLAIWFEDRREPVVLCEPGKPRSYTALSGVVLRVPACWEVEVVSLLDREVHRFHDPEARAGTLSVSVEPLESDDDRSQMAEELRRMGSLPGARVDGGSAAQTRAPDASEERYKPSVPDSLAERILHGSSGESGRGGGGIGAGEAGGDEDGAGGVPSANAAGEAGTAPSRAASSGGFHRVEAGGLLGMPPQPGKSALQPDGTYAKRTWNWLLVGDREAVRLVYSVRADWSESVIVSSEFRRASAVAESAAPAPSVSAGTAGAATHPAESAPGPAPMSGPGSPPASAPGSTPPASAP